MLKLEIQALDEKTLAERVAAFKKAVESEEYIPFMAIPMWKSMDDSKLFWKGGILAVLSTKRFIAEVVID